MEFFDKLGKKASEAYKMTADKTGKIAKETKMKLKVSELKTKVNEIYEEIGKKVYEKHTSSENISIDQELEEKCAQIDTLSKEIETLLQQCLELRDKKQCPKCYTEMDKTVNFCPNCGEKQEEIVEEIETSEDLENSKVEEEKEENKEEKENLEKTIAVEANVEIEENNQNENEDNLEKTVEIESDTEVENEEE